MLELHGVGDTGSGIERGTGAGHELVHVKRVLLIAERRGLGRGTVGRGRGALTAGHTINVVAHHDDGHVHVALGSVNEMVAADAGTVAVAGEHDNALIRVDRLQALGLRERSAMQSVQAVELQVHRAPGGAADAADERHFIFLYAEFIDRADEAVDYDAVAAAGAEDERKCFLTDIFFCDAVHITSPQQSDCKSRSVPGTHRRWS